MVAVIGVKSGSGRGSGWVRESPNCRLYFSGRQSHNTSFFNYDFYKKMLYPAHVSNLVTYQELGASSFVKPLRKTRTQAQMIATCGNVGMRSNGLTSRIPSRRLSDLAAPTNSGMIAN